MNAGRLMRRYQPIPWLLAVALAGACAGSAWAQPTRFAYSQDGSEVTDGQTGLVWRRCSEGQTYSGNTCTGTAVTFTHEGALVKAKSQLDPVCGDNTKSQVGLKCWRLPNVKELRSIVDTGRVNPSIDSVAFPATPDYRFWSSSPYLQGFGYAWHVNFNVGVVDGLERGLYGHVRLVR